jgi:hypothetical protein
MAGIVQEIHLQEWNAGAGTDEGFQIGIATDWTNGFALGGNEANCGIWTDKMGTPDRRAAPMDRRIARRGIVPACTRRRRRTHNHTGTLIENDAQFLIEEKHLGVRRIYTDVVGLSSELMSQ